ncbi:uncharacterized protein LOC113126570 [Mastacembelus armatus]|uniref:uncharacterized protein LOC113126570 n=1 Tax=Mastacembelus armatus TaxID=205130 RepID=UPI000E459CB5|nr:uncharacterized protein LOC113126570 [Mastacembelus armatus]
MDVDRDAELERQEEFLDSEEVFRRNACTIIEEMLELNNDPTEHTTFLVDEVLHCIFFLGNINKPIITPEEIVNDEEMLNCLKRIFPRAFRLFSSQLPKRDPFSCVLDMIVHLTGESNEDQIIEQLRNLNTQLARGEENHLVPSVICVSQNTQRRGSARHYGLSMSTSGKTPGQIMVAASCFSAWDSDVADAVMTYYPNKQKKPYFDGRINLPKYVRCEAFNLYDRSPKAPCKSCGDLFGLATTETKGWAHGNCAEVGSVSNLFKNEEEVQVQAQSQSDTVTKPENRKRVRERVRNHLKMLLKEKNFSWDNKFYPDIVFNL